MISGSLGSPMETTVERTDTHTVKLTIEVPPDEFGKDLDEAYRSIARQVKIPGFRKGKVPKQIIDAQIGRDAVIEEFLSSAVPVYFRDAVRGEDLAPIAEPDIDLEQVPEDGKDAEPLIFTATVEVRPRLELTDYKGVKVDRPDTSVTDEEVEDWVRRLRDRFAELEPAERAAALEDFVVFDIRGTIDGEEVEQLTRADYLHGIGSGEFGPVLDAELPGTKPGDIIEFDQSLAATQAGAGPGDASDDGKSVHFRVLVKEVKVKRLPEADDDFAKTASEFDTLDELKADLREKLHELKEREAVGVVRDRALAALVDSVEVDLPPSLVQHETDHRVEEATARAARSGLTLEQILETQGWDEDRFREDARDHAVRAITSDLVLEAIARAEDIDVTADEIGAEINALAQAYDRDPKELATQLDKSGQIVTLASDIIRTKALDLLVEHADIQTEPLPTDGEGEHTEARTGSEPEPTPEGSPGEPPEEQEENP
jgi:trigger factor